MKEGTAKVNFHHALKKLKEDLIDDLEGVLTVGDFYNRAHGEGSHLMFI